MSLIVQVTTLLPSPVISQGSKFIELQYHTAQQRTRMENLGAQVHICRREINLRRMYGLKIEVFSL